MKRIELEQNKRLWQLVAEAFRPTDNPYALYADDTKIGVYHLATLAINFDFRYQSTTLYNPYTLDTFPGGYQVAVPTELELAAFPKMETPEQVAELIGYVRDSEDGQPWKTPTRPMPVSDVPEWVRIFDTIIMQRRRLLGLEVGNV